MSVVISFIFTWTGGWVGVRCFDGVSVEEGFVHLIKEVVSTCWVIHHALCLRLIATNNKDHMQPDQTWDLSQLIAF